MKRIVLTGLFILALALAAAQTHAQDLSADFTKGSIIVGYDSRTCDGTLEGSIRYSSATKCAEVCDGTAWNCPASGGGCTAPAFCPNVGDVCTDGSLFAGFMLYADSCEALYVTDNNQSTASQWKNATGTDDISPDDVVDGRANHTNRGGTLSNFQPFDLCESNTYHSKSDWYLPARDELHLLWKNKSAIDANAAGNFTSVDYWSSTESSTTNAWSQHFGIGYHFSNVKTNSYDARCVRRD